MIKIINTNSIYIIGKAYEVRQYLFSIKDSSISLAEYIKKQAKANVKNLN